MNNNSTISSLKILLKNPEDTNQVFKLVSSLDRKSIKRCYEKLLKSDVGGEIAYNRKELLERLSDESWINGFEEGTVGWHYNKFIKEEQLSCKELMTIYETNFSEISKLHPHNWLARHLTNIHDIWHVLTGYGANSMGETALLAFTFAQTGSRGALAINIATTFKILRMKNRKYPFIKIFLEGYTNGKKASWLLLEDYEKMMREPIEDVRKRLNISKPTLYLPFAAKLKKIKRKKSAVLC